MRIFISVCLSAVILFTFSAYGNDNGTQANETASSQNENHKNSEEIDIVMTIGDIVITATLDNSQTSQEFLQTLPRTMTMRQWGDREYYGRLDAKLSENGEHIERYKNGDVTYYPPGPSFAIFYAKEDTSTQGNLIRMGSITSDLAVFDSLDDVVEIHIEIAP
jgi:hypothetical protein